jgi:hypothetical protein
MEIRTDANAASSPRAQGFAARQNPFISPQLEDPYPGCATARR